MSKYLLHCNDPICAHEFYGEKGDRCDWCFAGSYILQRLNPPPILQIRLFQLALKDQERDGFAFQAKQSRIYLDALKTAREGAKKALDASSETTLLHTCRNSNDPACFACAVHRPIGDFVKEIK